MAREQSESSASLTTRHLYNIAKLPAGEQPAFAKHVRDSKLTATDTEALLMRTRSRSNSWSTGLQARQRRFRTETAEVLITFNEVGATNADIEQILRAIREQLP